MPRNCNRCYLVFHDHRIIQDLGTRWRFQYCNNCLTVMGAPLPPGSSLNGPGSVIGDVGVAHHQRTGSPNVHGMQASHSASSSSSSTTRDWVDKLTPPKKAIIDDKKCPVCFEDMTLTNVVKLMCGHLVCNVCSTRWSQTQSADRPNDPPSCPLCRQPALAYSLKDCDPEEQTAIIEMLSHTTEPEIDRARASTSASLSPRNHDLSSVAIPAPLPQLRRDRPFTRLQFSTNRPNCQCCGLEFLRRFGAARNAHHCRNCNKCICDGCSRIAAGVNAGIFNGHRICNDCRPIFL